jgi:hypothetical protein
MHGLSTLTPVLDTSRRNDFSAWETGGVRQQKEPPEKLSRLNLGTLKLRRLEFFEIRLDSITSVFFPHKFDS